MACKACQDPLVLTVDPDSDTEDQSSPQTVPDDLLLPCACHFHWQCLIDLAPTVALSLRCPSCNAYLPSNAPAGSSSSTQPTPIPATYTSEGGTSTLDILPTLTEEAFLASHPAARPARAMHTMAAEGDVDGIIDLLQNVEDDDDGDSELDLLQWTDPLNGGKTALHVAMEAGQEEVFWLLLWLGSGIETGRFPEVVVQMAEARGVGRGEMAGREDVRGVKDGAGRTAGDVARGMGGQWAGVGELLG